MRAEGARADGIEAVSICTPNHVHFPAAKAFLEAGIHVICDKPMTSTLADARALAKIAETSGAIFVLTHNYSAYPQLRLAREMVARGWRLDHAAMRDRTAELLDQLECPIDPSAQVSGISVPSKQMVEIAKALSRDLRVLIMDEPTAVLTERDCEFLFRQIERLRQQGVAILYTSHKLSEVKRICDRVSALRDGSMVRSAKVSEITEDEMAAAMVGRELSDLYPAKAVPSAEVMLQVADLSVPGLIEDAGLSLRRGEVLGIGGLVGAGRTELAKAIAGLRPRSGEVRLMGETLPAAQVKTAMERGLAYLTEDRKGAGLLLEKGLRENLPLPLLHRFGGVLIDRKDEEAALDKAIADFAIRAPDREMPVGNLSGGNQQKLLLAKTLLNDPQVILIDDPQPDRQHSQSHRFREPLPERSHPGRRDHLFRGSAARGRHRALSHHWRPRRLSLGGTTR